MDGGSGKAGRFKQNMKARSQKTSESFLKNVGSATKTSGILNQHTQQMVTVTKPSTSRTQTQVSNIPTSNEYEMLSDIDDNTEDVQVTKTKNDKCAPIVIVNSNVTAVQNMCNEIIKSKKFEISLMSIGIKVQINNKDEFTAFENMLKDENIQSFKYYTHKNKPKRFVLLGLHKVKIDELKEYLEMHEIHPDTIEAIQLKRKLFMDEGQIMYKLLFRNHHTTLAELRQVRHIFNIKIKWDYYRSNNTIIPQCTRCLIPGHSSENCNMSPRCVVCAESHESSKCPKRIPRAELRVKQQAATAEAPLDRSFIKCANCSGAHTANYHGCPKIKEYRQILLTNSSKQARKSGNRNTFQYKQTDFPALHHRQYQTQPVYNTQPVRHPVPHPSTSWAELASQDNGKRTQLFSKHELLQFATDLIYKLAPCQTAEEQALAVVDVVTTYLYGGNK